MTTTLFAFPASAELQLDFQELTAAYANGAIPKEPMAPRFIAFAQRYADEILDALVLNLVSGADPDSHAPKTLENVVGLIKSTSHALIRQVLNKRSNKDLATVAEFMANRRVIMEIDGVKRDFISFPLAASDYQLLHDAWQKAASGEADVEAMKQATLRFAELSTQAFYVETGDAIELGFIAQKMFNMGHMAIDKALKMAINRLIPALKPRELKDFSSYFLGMLHSTD
ncbi:MAG: hypothetical protein Q8L72_03745 [Moraxellaceae bacterium]|nr:hypothetical protein [Moraxellaceae bacterium]